MSEKGKNPNERSKGAPTRHQREQEMKGERDLDPMADPAAAPDLQVEEALREKERKPNRK
jgi:hypothetical protein